MASHAAIVAAVTLVSSCLAVGCGAQQSGSGASVAASSPSPSSSTASASGSDHSSASIRPGASAYTSNARIAALAKRIGRTIYVPTSIPGSPAVTSASPFTIASPIPTRGNRYTIDFGSTLSAFITVGGPPAPLPQGAPLEQSFVVPGAGNADAAVWPSVIQTVPTPATTYEVLFNVGDLSESVSSQTLTEAQLIAVGKTLAPVPPGAGQPASTSGLPQA